MSKSRVAIRAKMSQLFLERHLSQRTIGEIVQPMRRLGETEHEKREMMAKRIIEIINASVTEEEMIERAKALE